MSGSTHQRVPLVCPEPPTGAVLVSVVVQRTGHYEGPRTDVPLRIYSSSPRTLAMVSLGWLARSRRVNALLGWVLTGTVVLGVVGSFRMDALLWGGFASVVAVVTTVPALSTGDWTVMPPWPLLLGAAVAVLARTIGVYSEIAGYFAVAVLALVTVVELDAFTPVDMSRRFASGFAVLTTMAVQGLWTIAQFYSDLWLGTEFLRSQTELQWNLVIVTGVGLLVGGIFTWYFDRFEHVGSAGQPMRSIE